MIYTIKDGHRNIKVSGEILAESSSGDGYKPRWVEFTLYKTDSGAYVVHRVGRSRLYHDESCSVVARNHLTPSYPLEDLAPGIYTPCSDCRPNWGDPEGVYPEVDRHHAQVCQTPQGVLNYLTKEDSDRSRYLTRVARELLEEASYNDSGINDAYEGEVIK